MGVAFANIVRGVPIDANREYAGGFVDLLNPYALLGGLTTLGLFVTHGALFLALKTTGTIRAQANALAGRVGCAAPALAVAFLAWTLVLRPDPAALALSVVAALALRAWLGANRARREGSAFLGTAATLALAVAALFAALFPDVMPSTLNEAWSLTTSNASSTPYTLRLMTVVAVVFTSLVLLYQAWTYHVFRRRVDVEHMPTHDEDATAEANRT